MTETTKYAGHSDHGNNPMAWSILKAMSRLKSLPPGQTLEIFMPDEDSLNDCLRYLNKSGREVVRVNADGNGFIIKVKNCSRKERAGHGPDRVQETNRRCIMSDLSNVQGAIVVDARGSACPGPLLEAKKGIGKVRVGEVLEVLSNDPGTRNDIPVWAGKVGHEFMGHSPDDGYDRLFIRRKK